MCRQMKLASPLHGSVQRDLSENHTTANPHITLESGTMYHYLLREVHKDSHISKPIVFKLRTHNCENHNEGEEKRNM
jgi:hypothetical protein